MRSDPDREWEDLAASAPPFLRPAFFHATARWLARRGRPLVLTARSRGKLQAVLPVLSRRGAVLALGSPHTPRYDLVGDPAAVPELWRVLRQDVSWRSLELRGVPEGSPLARELVACARCDGCPLEVATGSGSPYMPLADFERELDGRFRRNLIARRRKLPALWFERVTTADPVALADLFRIEAAAWKGEAGTAIAADRALVGFYREIAHRFAASGNLSLSFLCSGGRRIAAHFALEDAGTYYLLKTGYDPAYAGYGPGHLIVYEAALEARERGLREFDFLGQDMEWKRQWTQRVRRHVRIQVYRRSAAGLTSHALQYRVRPALGRVRASLRL